MSMLRAPGSDNTDAVIRPAVPLPRRPLAGSSRGSVRALRPAAPGSAAAPGPGGQAGGGGRPDGGVQVRQLRVREVHVRELRTGARHEYQLAARELRSRQAGPGTAARTQTRAVTAVRTRPSPAPGRVRLTRRGRRVLAGFAIVMAMAAISLLWIGVAGGAQAASHHSPAGSAYRGLTRVVVQPGQTLWSIAAKAEPGADPRSVIQQIIEVNAISTTEVQPGELLWVPRG